MRLTALCVCGTLLAFSSLSRIRAEEGVLLGDRGFGPCIATLRPVGACRPGDHDNMCPFHINLPPLVVHLPQRVLELENIMQDLQKLKESVDELREMCADCAGGQAARNCERENEGELNGGKNTNEDEGDWLNERLEENDRNFRQECGKDGVMVETMDGNNKEKKLKDGNEWETGGVVKENGRGEPVTEDARGEDTLKKPTSVNVTRGKIAEINPKGSSRKIQDLLDKNKEKTKEETSHPIWRDKTKVEKNTKAEAIDRIKMSKNHTMNINKEQGQIEMEKGIKVDPNKKKPKQMERFRLTEKGREIKTESVQRDDDEETSSSKTTKKTDFLSISLTPLTTELTSRPDLSDSKSFTSSLPSPSLLSSTLSSITDVTRDPKAGYGLTGSTEPGAAGVTEPQRQVKGRLSTATETISTVGGPGQQIAIADVELSITTPTTSSPLHTVFITSSSKVTDRSHGAPKKNISSKPKTNLKPPSIRAPKPGEKHKSGIKPEADKKLKNAKNDHKPNQGPSTEEKPKLNQRNKPHKPTGVKFKPGKDSKQIQNKKPGQKNSTDISTPEENLKSNLMHKQEGRANETQSKQNSSTAVQRPAAQRPPAVNATHSGKYKLTNRKSDKVSNTDQNLKPGKKFVHVFITNKPDQKSDKILGEEKSNETIILQNPNHSSNPTDEVNPPESKYIQKIPTFKPEPTSEYKSTPKPNQIPSNEFVGTFEENMEQEITNSPDLTSGQKNIAERPNTSPDNTNDSTQNHFKPSQEFETETATPLAEAVDISEENSLQEPKYNPDLTPGQTYVPDQATVTPDQKKNSSQDRLKIKSKTESTQESSSESNKIETSTKTPQKALLTEPLNKSNKNPSHDPKSNPDVRPGQTSAPDQPAMIHHLMNKSSLGIHETKHKRKPKPSKPKSQRSETTASPKPYQKILTHVGDKSEENPSRKSKNPSVLTPRLEVISDRANTTFDYMNKSSQESHKTKHKPENNREDKFEKTNNSDEHSLQEFISNPHLTPGQTSVLDQATKHSDQMTKSSEDHLKETHKSENIQGFKSNKSETANTKPSTKSVGVSEGKSWQEPTPNPGIRPHRGTTSPDQIIKSSGDHLKPENIHKIKFNKSETATSKSIQELFPESVDQSEDIPTPYPDLTAGQTSAPNQATTVPDQIDKYNRKHLKPQASQDSQSPTVTRKPLIESRDRFQGKTLQKPTSDPGQAPAETSTIDLATATTYWVIKTGQDHLKTKENPEKIHNFTSNQNKAATPKPKQKPLPETVEENSLQQTKLYPDLAHGQTSTPGQATTAPDHMDAFNNEYIETQTSKEFKFYKTETASQKPSIKTWNKSKEISLQEPTLDLAPAVPNQKKKSTNSDSQTKHSQVTKFNKSEKRPKPLTESWENSEEASLQKPTSKPGLALEETSTSALATAKTDQITKTIQDRHGAKQNPGSNKGFNSNKSDTATPKSNQKSSSESKSKEQEHKNKSDSTFDSVKISPDQRSKPGSNVPKFSKTPKPGQENRQNQKNPKVDPSLKTRPNANLKTNQTKQINPRLKPSTPGLTTNLKPMSVPEKIIKPAHNKTSKLRLPFRHKPSTRPTVRPGAKPVQRPKQAVEPKPSPQTNTNPPQISWVPSGNIQNFRTDMPPTSGLVKQIAKVSHTLGETKFSTSVRKTITLSPKTSNSLKNGYFPATNTQPEDVTSSPNTRITSDPRPQTAGLLSSAPMTTRPNDTNRRILQNVITSTGPGATQLSVAPKSMAKTHHGEESPHASPVSHPSLKTTSTLSPKFRSKTSSTSGPEPLPAEMSTPSPRELRVKINQVAAFVNNSLIPNRRPDELPKEQPKESQTGEGPERTHGKIPTSAASAVIRDCSDHLLRGKTRSGLYLVTPDLRSSSFQVFCDMELDGGGWTLLQRRQDGSVSFNRSWVEYQAGFGVLDGGEFWLGNNKMHLLTRDRDMELRVELEDFDGVTEHAQYENFRVASERLRYRLTVGGYSGTAGNALRFSKTYDHNNRAFTTPDRDNDRYPSGNCGAYYSSGWWFDACMAANLNGKYYFGKYKGVRDGIFWGTWHNISTEYYPTNERQSFKSVRMMTRPKSFGLP